MNPKRLPDAQSPIIEAVPAARNMLDLTDEVVIDITDTPQVPPMPGVSSESVEYVEDIVTNDWRVRECLRQVKELDPITTLPHVVNTGLLVAEMAQVAGLSQEDQKAVTIAAIVHDIGKTTIHKDVIKSDERIDMREDTPVTRAIKMHPENGAKMVQNIFRDDESPEAHLIRLLVAGHHCQIEGRVQYPDVKAQKMMIEESVMGPEDFDDARYQKLVKLLAVVDVYEAITGKRAYQTKSDQLDNPDKVRTILAHGFPEMSTVINRLMDIHAARFPATAAAPGSA